MEKPIIAWNDMENKLPDYPPDTNNSDHHYRNLFDNSSSVMLIINPESGQLLDVNAAACDYYQYSREDLLALKIMDINILSKDEISDEMHNAVGEKRNYFHFKHRLADKQVRDVEVFSSPITLSGQKVLFSIIHDISKRMALTKERDHLIADLKEALSRVKMLSGLLPICASCKKIRDDDGYWEQIESYIRDHADVEFSHAICPDCSRKIYPELQDRYPEK